GIVQALLITKHMLFVGFSLTDENFHRIADDVRRAMSGQGQSDLRCGTAMVLSPDPLMAELWLPEIACTPVSEGGGATRAAARELEIFLDRVLAECTDMTSHILDDTFEHLLSPGELELRSALRAMEYALGGDARSTGAFSRVEQLLVDLGLGKDSERGGTGETQ
ncbi:MAG: SIR2 family protein, partial [Dehalococcoidia bacterium]|nr:SIR2 family protein [Dehalococcoidia bacterium]